jgi:hypothetical protein
MIQFLKLAHHKGNITHNTNTRFDLNKVVSLFNSHILITLSEHVNVYMDIIELTVKAMMFKT